MTQKDKELLLKDLSARLPYGVKAVDSLNQTCTLSSILTSQKYKDNIFVGLTFSNDEVMTGIEFIKPFLRSMLSMTEEERAEYHSYCDNYYDIYFDSVESIDWLNKNMFDYRGFTEKGLANEAPKGMYK